MEDSPARRQPRWRRWLALARVVYLAALGGFLAYLVWERREALAELFAAAEPLWVAAAFVLALGQLLPSTLVWTLATRRLSGRPVRLADTVYATVRSVPARYLPGSVWYAVGRAAVLRQRLGVPVPALGGAAVLETVLAVVLAIALGSGLLLAAGRLPGRGWWLAAWFIGLLVVGSPPAVNRAARFVARRRGVEHVDLDWRVWAQLVGLTILHWGWSATTFTVYLQAFPGLTRLSVVEVAGSFLVAWVAGFLAVFAPQGAGAFEAAVGAMLVPSAAGTAAIVAAGYRVVVLLRDATVFLGSTVWTPRRGG